MTKILVATDKPFVVIAVNGIKKVVQDAGYEFTLLEKYTDPTDLYKAVADADALIVRSDLVTPEVLEAGKKLKIVVRAGAGYDNINLPAATEKKIVVMNTPGQNSNAVAELAIGMMVYNARAFFSGKSGTELRGKTLGLHAFGFVAKAVAAIAKGFGMKIYGFDPFVTQEDFKSLGVESVASPEELYSKCQYVSLHMPANAKTKGTVNYDLLSRMPEGAVLVNTARPEVIDEAGLLKMFAERKDFTYLSDVPPVCKPELEEKYAGRFYITPKKMGAQTEEANINAGIAAAVQICKYFQSGDTTFQVNK